MTLQETSRVKSPEIAAQELLEMLWAPDTGRVALPVNPIDIAEKLDVKVYFAGLDEGVSGMLLKKVGQDAEIYINSADSRNRQRFTCAHELGHYMRRMSVESEGGWGYVDRRSPLTSEGTDEDEIWANRFAASLLMPRRMVQDMYDQHSLPVLAVKFGVSVEAMGFRLDDLRLR